MIKHNGGIIKKLICAALIITILALSGCTSSGTNNGNRSEVKDEAIASDSSSGADNTAVSVQQNQDSSISLSQKAEASGDLKPVKPGTVPELSPNQKTMVNKEINPVLNEIDSALKSLQDPQDIDITSIN